jgi:hypothetical protein
VAASEPSAAEAQASEAKPAARKSAARKAPARRSPGPAAAASNGNAPVVSRQVTDEDIRVRAYFLSLEHRGQGSDIDFWLIAERELRSRAASRD